MQKYDYFLCMDGNNLRNLRRIIPSDPAGKVHKLMEYAGSNADVADPWYTDRFDICYNDILSGCEGLLNSLLKKS